jgi:hypothetical protein
VVSSFLLLFAIKQEGGSLMEMGFPRVEKKTGRRKEVLN